MDLSTAGTVPTQAERAFAPGDDLSEGLMDVDDAAAAGAADDDLPIDDFLAELDDQEAEDGYRRELEQLPDPAGRGGDQQPQTPGVRAGLLRPFVDQDVILPEEVLFERLQAANFAGPEYERFVTTLTDRTYPLTKKWIRSGRMAVECRKRKRAVHTVYGATEDDLDDLAADTVIDGLVLFKKVALDGGLWKPGRASLTTYFFGACINVYPTIHRRWVRAVNVQRDVAKDATRVLSTSTAFESASSFTMDLRAGLRRLPDRYRHVLAMSEAGYSHKEIAKAIGGTPKSVERMINRARKQLRGDLDAGKGASDV